MAVEFFTPRKKWFQQIVPNLLLLTSLIINGLLWWFWLTKLSLGYLTVYSPIVLANVKKYSYLIPTTALLLLIVNFVLYLAAYKKIRALAYLFLSTAFISQVLFLLVTAYYLMSK
jgi:hypothetical protein